MKILIVDDHATNRKLLRAQLEGEGLEVAEAADGLEALRALGDEPFDAVVSDILMPRMDGYRLCHEVRQSEKFRGLRFILYSSTYTSPSDVKLSATVGADQFIAKPASTGTIRAALQRVQSLPSEREAEMPDENFVLREYSAALVSKLEEKNTELRQSLDALERAHGRIVDLNRDLESRVQERTAELKTANAKLQEALDNVKELRGLLPICSHCKKIRDGGDYWHSVENYIAAHSHAKFTHGICPECYNKVAAELELIPGSHSPPAGKSA